MKYTTYLSILFIACTLFTSCKKDDVTETDPLIGTWQIHEVFVAEIKVPFDDCFAQTTFEFTQDFKFIGKTYEIDDDDVCFLDTGVGVWDRVNNNAVKIIIDNDAETIMFSFVEGNLKISLEIDDVSSALIFKKINT